jgi:hypothetical protein
MFARIGVMRALNRDVECVFDSSRKETRWESASWRGIGEAFRLVDAVTKIRKAGTPVYVR